VAISVEAPMESNWIWNLLIQLLAPVAFFALLWWLMIRQAQGVNTQAMAFGRANVKPLVGKTNVTFADVAGVDEAKEELKEIVDFLKNPGKFQALGAKIPKGLLLMGAPGTGKTLLARAIAGEADVPFFSISGSDFVEMFVGVGAARVRSVFEQAKKQTPSIIFMDEVDAVGRHRGAGLGGGHDEREQTLNQLLVEMDGFDPKTNIIVIAATNRPDILDPALLRPGRFDRQIVLDKPDLKGREDILKIHAKGKPLAAGVNLNVVARRTSGFTGADLENVLNEAAILAARAEKKEVTMEEIEEAVDRVMAGPEKKSRVISDREKKIVAYHEVGHAVLSQLLPNADKVHKISILPRGMALGYTLQLPLEDKYLVTKGQALDQITVMMGGRVAEEMFFNEVTSGAHNDLEKATEIAKRMVTEFGMSELGPRTFGRKDRQIFLGRDIAEMKDYSEQTADSIDREVGKIINACHTKAREVLEKRRPKVEEMAKVLIEKETLENSDLEEALKGLE
jgi:cell division protease FtsH